MIRKTRPCTSRRGRAATRWLMSGCMALVMLPCALAAATMPQAAASPALDGFATRAMQTFDTPGMAVVVVDGDTVATHGYGVRRLGAPARPSRCA